MCVGATSIALQSGPLEYQRKTKYAAELVGVRSLEQALLETVETKRARERKRERETRHDKFEGHVEYGQREELRSRGDNR